MLRERGPPVRFKTIWESLNNAPNVENVVEMPQFQNLYVLWAVPNHQGRMQEGRRSYNEKGSKTGPEADWSCKGFRNSHFDCNLNWWVVDKDGPHVAVRHRYSGWSQDETANWLCNKKCDTLIKGWVANWGLRLESKRNCRNREANNMRKAVTNVKHQQRCFQTGVVTKRHKMKLRSTAIPSLSSMLFRRSLSPSTETWLSLWPLSLD